jgi:hypothetical protein
MPSRNARTPYPPAAQLFFRLMVTLWESARVMKCVLTLLDIATIFIVLQWLRVTGRSEWLVLGYAWNPLVILEVAHSGHIDGLGVFWIALCAYWMTRRRTSLAAVAFTLAVATKLLPIVLAPLFLGRVKPRDIAIGAGALLLLYLPFMTAGVMPIGAVPNVVEHIRFNSPIFRPLAWAVTPTGAAVFALAAGLAAAAWVRWKLDVSAPRPGPGRWQSLSPARPSYIPGISSSSLRSFSQRRRCRCRRGPGPCCPSTWSGSGHSSGLVGESPPG